MRRESTAHLIKMKASSFWRLWEEFVPCLVKLIQLGGMALMELPRGCDYWKDDRLTSVLDGSDHRNHEFDGCMYGLKTKFTDEEESLKKPWRIVSWGVEFPSMRKKCDHSMTMENVLVGRRKQLNSTLTKSSEQSSTASIRLC